MGNTSPNELQILVQSLKQLIKASRHCKPRYAQLGQGLSKFKGQFYNMSAENDCLADELESYTRQYDPYEFKTDGNGYQKKVTYTSLDEELNECENETLTMLNVCEGILKHRYLSSFPELYKDLKQRRENIFQNLDWIRNVRVSVS